LHDTYQHLQMRQNIKQLEILERVLARKIYWQQNKHEKWRYIQHYKNGISYISFILFAESNSKTYLKLCEAANNSSIGYIRTKGNFSEVSCARDVHNDI